MAHNIIAFCIWLSGFLLCRWMLFVEHKAESKPFTNGDKALLLVMSVLSYVAVMIMLISTWVKSVGNYWKQLAESENKKSE